MPASSTAAAGSSWPRRGPPSSRFELDDDERRFLVASREKVDRDRVARIAAASPGHRRARRGRGRGDRAGRGSRSCNGATPTVKLPSGDAGELAGLATLAIDEDPERAILLGLAALERTDEPSAEVLSALHRATQSTRLTSRVDGVMSVSMDQSPDGSLLAVDRLDRTGYVLIDTASGSDRRRRHDGLPRSADFGLAFDPTGSTLAVGPRERRGRVSARRRALRRRVESTGRFARRVRPATTAALCSTTRPVAGWGRSGRNRLPE